MNASPFRDVFHKYRGLSSTHENERTNISIKNVASKKNVKNVASTLKSHTGSYIDAVNNRTSYNKMTLNAKKTKNMWIYFTNSIPQPPSLHNRGTEIEKVKIFKFLGVQF